MGVTVHFEGQLRNSDSYEGVIKTATDFAAACSWRVSHFESKLAKLSRVRDERDWDYEGPTRGVELQPHPSSEPIRLEFDGDLYVQEYTKTQFAPQEVHEELIALLDLLKPWFHDLAVEDEGEYFETRDSSLLEHHRARCFELMDEHLASDSSLRGPVRLPSGRIADLIRDDA